jgi:hypothetical protein
MSTATLTRPTTQLTITIGDRDYRVRRITRFRDDFDPDDENCRTAAVRLEPLDGGKPIKVARLVGDGPEALPCTCRGRGLERRRPGTPLCRHARALVRFGLLFGASTYCG